MRTYSYKRLRAGGETCQSSLGNACIPISVHAVLEAVAPLHEVTSNAIHAKGQQGLFINLAAL